MKFRSLLMSGWILALMALIAIGCNENPSDPDPEPEAPEAPTNLMAATTGLRAVNLSWTASTTADVTYTVSWEDANSNGGTAENVTGTTYAATLDNPATVYTFSVIAVDADGNTSTAAELDWAGAAQYVNDAAVSTMTIRMYEGASASGSGLVLDPATPKFGPKNVSVLTYTPLGDVQLAFYINEDNTFNIGPAYSMTEFQNAANFDQNVFISDEIVAVPSLEGWYMGESLDNFISSDGNLKVFENIAGSRTDGNGLGFVVRTGTAGNYHYARIFVVAGGQGNIVRGQAPDRFVQLLISYQTTPNLPYAKAAGSAPEAAYTATRRR